MAASTSRAEKQQGNNRQAAAPSFDAMHGALASEAHSVARDFGVDVLTVAFHPDHAAGADDAPRAVSHEFLGVAPAERVRRLVATDVSAMGPAELAVHAARLRALRATLVRQMQGTEKKQGVDDDGEVMSSRSSERRRDGRRCPAPPPGKIRMP